MRVRFGDCELDRGARQLSRGGAPVDLTPKALQLLELLLERRPEAVSKQQIYDSLWPATFVAEVNLARLMFEIREALGDDARAPRYVRTVRRFGYAFCGSAAELAAPRSGKSGLSCWLVSARGETALGEGENVLGRSRQAAVRIDSKSVSRRHARIVVTDGQGEIEDLGSKNGTFLNGRRLDGVERLSDGDDIRVGTVAFSFRVVPDELSTATEG